MADTVESLFQCCRFKLTFRKNILHEFPSVVCTLCLHGPQCLIYVYPIFPYFSPKCDGEMWHISALSDSHIMFLLTGLRKLEI